MSQKQDSTPGQFLLIGMFLIFLTLKLCNVIDWSWWWVTAPLWMPFALGLVLSIGAVSFLGATHGKR
jgi:membrane protein YdbS with pleckstrin-like domain